MNIAKGTIFLLLPGLGMVGNLYVFVNYVWTFFLNAEKKPIHIILIHLTFTYIIMILTKGMPQVMVAFGVKNFLHDTGCKMVIFLGRVARGLSISTYSLLTVVQAITISPRTSIKSTESVLLLMLCFLLFYWIDSIITSYVNYSLQKHFILILVHELLSLGHVNLSPFVMIYRDRRLSKCWHIWKT
ncbi:olfactory receptor class A-like protein 1 [Tupaia chinensis]|uniref:olfactory receptor class A-like protein 1 n=1 Tax=Tupaia chinensis TaxID=246437 RepID=UPI000FFBB69D|nr:olfactory receptor class A-like protein 1 [Tupaia chinensis]